MSYTSVLFAQLGSLEPVPPPPHMPGIWPMKCQDVQREMCQKLISRHNNKFIVESQMCSFLGDTFCSDCRYPSREMKDDFLESLLMSFKQKVRNNE